jgi:hypothetical protein
MQQEILPQALAGGLKKIAAVIKPDVFQEFYIKNVSKEATKSDQLMQNFDSLESAYKWLKED